MSGRSNTVCRFTACLPILCALLGTSCHDGSEDAAPPRTGEIRVAVSMTGADVPATYSVLLGTRAVSTPATAAAVVAGLLPGNYDVTIRVARNCQVDGENPRAATVVVGQTTSVAFSVTCVAATGFLRVTTVTTGVDLDADGYTIRVDGFTVEGKPYQETWRLAATGIQTITGVPVGDDMVRLTGMSINCDPTQESQRTVTVSSAETIDVAFTIACAPNTGRLAYVVGSAPGIRHIYVIDLTGSGGNRLTDNASSDEDPAWSPDGKKIAFTTDRDGNREIYVSNADGSNAVRLTNNSAADYQPAWSRDGARIAFVSEREGDPEIFAMDADGSAVVRLTTSVARETEPAWSPAGQIAFTSDRDGASAIYVMNSDGSGTMRLTATEGAHPAWSPDGTRLAYAGLYCQFYYECHPVIFVKFGSGVDAPFGLNLPAESPSWSPDGRKIAVSALNCDFYYITCTPGVVQIARLGDPSPITLTGGFSPAWRP